ncbi:DUF3572 domain-containing protein [Lutimaribacter marinistellae]|uniref:DUF3572 domain-containing protein n=1 Tax=Lutimaribacter marinistellae TaxID=1820329 RepID=A0ABV7TMT8_9RHOB
MPNSADAAETLALGVLAWLVANEDLLPVFLGATGASEADLRARAGDRDFLVSVLDFLVMDDLWVVAFCDATGTAYDRPERARAMLAGAAGTHWT